MWSVLTTAYENWSRHRSARMGAALAYYSVFSLGPLLLIVISIAEGEGPPRKLFALLVLFPGATFPLLGGPALYLCTARGRRWYRTTTHPMRRRALYSAWIPCSTAFLAFLIFALTIA